MAYFYLQLADADVVPMASAPYDTDSDELLAEPGRVGGWQRLELTSEDSRLTDYLANDAGVRLCSERLRSVLDASRSEADTIQWLDAQVRTPDGGVHPFWILHLVAHPDVLDPSRTIRARDDFVVKAVVSCGAAAPYKVFGFPGATTRLIVSGDVRDAVIEATCTGIEFSEVASV